MTAMTTIVNAMDRACNALVRTLILTDRAPSCAKATATDAAARNGMTMWILSGVGVGKEKAPWTVRSRAV